MIFVGFHRGDKGGEVLAFPMHAELVEILATHNAS